jgi:hypothetical protein
VAVCDEIEVVDPRHPLYGRRYRLISIGKELTTRGACKGSFARVHYRFGLTLPLPLGATNLERNVLSCAAPTKLNLDALQDLIALAEESEGKCPSNLDRSGAASKTVDLPVLLSPNSTVMPSKWMSANRMPRKFSMWTRAILTDPPYQSLSRLIHQHNPNRCEAMTPSLACANRG